MILKDLRTTISDSPLVPDIDPRRALVDRITASRHFSRAPRLKAFLAFVTERAISGRAAEITEHEIASAVFERREDFHPANDNIVRVAARQFRARLKDFEQDEGAHEEWVVEVPRGSYTPVFHKRASAPVPVGQSSNRTVWALCFGVALCLLAATGFWLRGQRNVARISAESDLFSSVLLSDNNRVWIVPADSGLSLQQLAHQGSVDLKQYIDRRSAAPIPPWLDHREGRVLWQAIESRDLVHAALAAIPQRLVRNRPEAAERIYFRHPKTLSTRDFKSDNFALLGMTNPWVDLFESSLNFQVENKYPAAGTRVVNRNPRRGEPAAFTTPVRDGNDVSALARVALVPNLARNGRVLIVTGLGTYKTEAASELLLGSGSARLVRRALGVSDGDPIPDFEMVLQVTELGGAGTSAKVVAARKSVGAAH